MFQDGWFHHFANAASRFAGRPATFLAAVGIVIAWALTGPFAGFSEVWQLVINTATTIITFLMVFLIQSTQNRDTAAIQLKLDELIHATANAQDTLLDLEELSEEKLEAFRKHYEALARRAREKNGSPAEASG